MQLVAGLLLDRFGTRKFVLPAILACAAGVAVFAVSANPVVAGIGRLLSGLGASFAFVGALYVVNHWFPARQFAVLSGAVNAIGMMGTAIGAIVLTSFIGDVGWQNAFFATSAAGLLIFVLAFLFLRESDDVAKTKPAATHGFIAPLSKVVKTLRIWLIGLVGALYYMPINIFGGLWGSAELSQDHGLSPIEAETAVSMIFWGMALGGISAGALSDYLGHRKWIVVAGSLLAAVAFASAIYSSSQSELFLSAMLFLGGFFSGGQMLTFAMAKEGQPASVSGTVIAFVNMLGISGALFFQPLIGAVIDLEAGQFGVALLALPLCLLAAAIIALFVSEERHIDHAV